MTQLWPALPGFGGTGLLYPVLLSEGMHKRGLAAAPGRRAGLGATRPAPTACGRARVRCWSAQDADLTVVDPDLEQEVTTDLLLSGQDHCPFDGPQGPRLAGRDGGARPGRLPRRRRHRRAERHLPAPLNARCDLRCAGPHPGPWRVRFLLNHLEFEVSPPVEEYPLAQPYADLPYASALIELTDRCREEAEAGRCREAAEAGVWWGDRLDVFLQRGLQAPAGP